MTRQSELKKNIILIQGSIQDNTFGAAGAPYLEKEYLTKYLEKRQKKKVKFTPPPPPKKTDLPKKAGDKIVKMLSSTKPPKMTNQEINNIVLQIMSGGKIAPQGRKII